MARAHDKARKKVEKDVSAVDAQLTKDEADWVRRSEEAPDPLAASCYRQQAANVARLRAMERRSQDLDTP